MAEGTENEKEYTEEKGQSHAGVTNGTGMEVLCGPKNDCWGLCEPSGQPQGPLKEEGPGRLETVGGRRRGLHQNDLWRGMGTACERPSCVSFLPCYHFSTPSCPPHTHMHTRVQTPLMPHTCARLCAPTTDTLLHAHTSMHPCVHTHVPTHKINAVFKVMPFFGSEESELPQDSIFPLKKSRIVQRKYP